jgi:hypothetical protein
MLLYSFQYVQEELENKNYQKTSLRLLQTYLTWPCMDHCRRPQQVSPYILLPAALFISNQSTHSKPGMMVLSSKILM